MATNIMRNTDFRSEVEPILNEVFDGIYDQRKDEYLQVFRVKTGIARDQHQEPTLFGFGAAPELPEGMPVTYQAGGELYTKTYIYKRYGLAFALTSTLIEDADHIRIGSIYSRALAQSLVETKELLTANVLNTAFTGSSVGDGVSLVNASHPLAIGTASNLLTPAAMSDTSVLQGLISIRANGVDGTGKKVHLNPESLVVSPSNEFQGEVIVRSVLRSGTANNDLNAIKSRGYLSNGVAVITRMTSTTAWFIHNDTSTVPDGLQVVMRSPLKKTMEGDFETDSWRYKAIERYDVGCTDWRALYGNAGA